MWWFNGEKNPKLIILFFTLFILPDAEFESLEVTHERHLTCPKEKVDVNKSVIKIGKALWFFMIELVLQNQRYKFFDKQQENFLFLVKMSAYNESVLIGNSRFEYKHNSNGYGISNEDTQGITFVNRTFIKQNIDGKYNSKDF